MDRHRTVNPPLVPCSVRHPLHSRMHGVPCRQPPPIQPGQDHQRPRPSSLPHQMMPPRASPPPLAAPAGVALPQPGTHNRGAPGGPGRKLAKIPHTHPTHLPTTHPTRWRAECDADADDKIGDRFFLGASPVWVWHPEGLVHLGALFLYFCAAHLRCLVTRMYRLTL